MAYGRSAAVVVATALGTMMLAAAPPPRGSDAEKLELHLYRGEFTRAKELAAKSDKEKPHLPLYDRLVVAEKQIAKKQFEDARRTFQGLYVKDRFKLLAKYWFCQTQRLEGRIGVALKCFKEAGIDPYHVSRWIKKRSGDGTVADTAFVMDCECPAHCVNVPLVGEQCQTMRWTATAPDDCVKSRPPECKF